MDNNNNDPDSRPDRLDEADLEIQKRLETVITRLGETPSNQNNQDQQPQSIQQYIQQLTKYLDDLSQILELDLEDHKAFILRILTLCAYQLPQKCCIYTTLVGLINAKDFSIGNEFLDLLIKELDILLKQERWDEARYMIRFICDLVNANVVSTESVIMFLETLLDVVQEENIPFVRKDWYSFAILSALPWCGKELYDKEDARSHLDEIVLCIEQYLRKFFRVSFEVTFFEFLISQKMLQNSLFIISRTHGPRANRKTNSLRMEKRQPSSSRRVPGRFIRADSHHAKQLLARKVSNPALPIFPRKA